jgi:TPR repeat protein
MSSPIHHAEDLDEALHYAPPWAREQRRRDPERPSAQLIRPPQSLRRFGMDGPAFSGDQAMAKLQRQLALDPDAVPEPPVSDIESLRPMALRLCAVAGVAAAAAWLIISPPDTRFLRSNAVPAVVQESPPAVANVATQDPLHTPAAAGLLLQHGLAEATAVPAPVPAPALAASTPAPASAPAPVEATPAAAAQPAAEPSSNVAMAQGVSVPLGSDEIAMLLKRGKDAVSNGDLAAARLLLRRAAEAGSAEAAMALGATFDPLVIRRLGAIGTAPDAAQARQWYQKAVALGSTAAAQPLATLQASAQ